MGAKFSWRLALDTGSASIGWAAFREDEQGRVVRLLDGGVRLFDSGRNPQSKISLLAERGLNRRARGRIRARKWRRDQLRRLLQDRGLAQAETSPLAIYDLRAKAVGASPVEPSADAPDCPIDPTITDTELAAIFFHLLKHRGFKSPRLSAAEPVKGKKPRKVKRGKADESDAKREQDAAKEEDSEVQAQRWKGVEDRLIEAMAARRACPTVGVLLARKLRENGFVRGRHGESEAPTRNLIAQEFSEIRKFQASRFGGKLSPADWDTIADLILDQRPFRDPTPGRCSVFPDEDRIAKCMPSAQAFLIGQALCNLRIAGASFDAARPLTDEEFAVIAAILEKGGVHSWPSLRKAIKLKRQEKFTIEQEKSEGKKEQARQIAGNLVNGALQDIVPGWRDLSLAERDRLVEGLFKARRKRRDLIAAIASLGLDEADREKLADIVQFELPRGRIAYGRTAIERILPRLRAGQDAKTCIDAAIGRDISDRRPDRMRDRLPYYGEVLQGHVFGGDGGALPDPARAAIAELEAYYGRIGNITVHIALNEIRKIVNALLARYGNPRLVVIETTRDLKASAEKLRAIEREQKAREEENRKLDEDAKSADRDRGGRAFLSLPERRRRLRLCKRQKGKSTYSGIPIARDRLFTEDYCIDHIIPASRGGRLEDANLVLCSAEDNQAKRDQTPWEKWHDDPRWRVIMEEVKNLPESMHWRFKAEATDKVEADDEGYLPRAIRDTSYIARLALQYLRHIAPPQNVVASRGSLTAYLRAVWNLPKGREDNRHHFVDAAVLALTDRGIVQWINRWHARGALPRAAESGIELPYADFTREIEKEYARLWPSIRPDHSLSKPSGALHRETLYGMCQDESGAWRRTERLTPRAIFTKDGKPLSDEDAEKALDKFVSQRFRSVLIEKMENLRQSTDAVDADDRSRSVWLLRALASKHFGPRGVGKIKCWCDKIPRDPEEEPRILRGASSNGAPNWAYVDPNANAWLEFDPRSNTGETVVVSKFVAAIEKRQPKPGAFVLRRGDCVAVEINGQIEICFVKIIKTSGKFFLWPLRVAKHEKAMAKARPDLGITERDGKSFSIGAFFRHRGRKVSISLLGRLRDPGPAKP